MTRKTSSDKDGTKASKGKDYVKLKTLLEDFVDGGCKEYIEDIDDILIDTANTGVVRMPWKLMKPLLRYKIDKILNESFGPHSDDDNLPQQLLELLDKFNGPPFTIQRLCELIVEPCVLYHRRDRYMRALEKNLLVVTTQEPDLVWMKVPKLSQLLEVKPSVETQVMNSPDCILENKEPVMSVDLPSPSWKLSRSPVSPRSPLSPKSPRSPRSHTPPPDFEYLSGRNWEGLIEPHPILLRKRSSSSLFDSHISYQSHVTHVTHVQLQEADSTVSDQPLLEGTETGKRPRIDSDDDDDSVIIKALLGVDEATPTNECDNIDKRVVNIDECKEQESREATPNDVSIDVETRKGVGLKKDVISSNDLTNDHNPLDSSSSDEPMETD